MRPKKDRKSKFTSLYQIIHFSTNPKKLILQQQQRFYIEQHPRRRRPPPSQVVLTWHTRFVQEQVLSIRFEAEFVQKQRIAVQWASSTQSIMVFELHGALSL